MAIMTLCPIVTVAGCSVIIGRRESVESSTTRTVGSVWSGDVLPEIVIWLPGISVWVLIRD